MNTSMGSAAMSHYIAEHETWHYENEQATTLRTSLVHFERSLKLTNQLERVGENFPNFLDVCKEAVCMAQHLCSLSGLTVH